MKQKLKSFHLYGFHCNPAVEQHETWAVTSLLLFTLGFINLYTLPAVF